MLYFSFSSKQKMMPFYLGDFKAAWYEKFLLTVRWGPNQKKGTYNGNHRRIPMPGSLAMGFLRYPIGSSYGFSTTFFT